MDRQEQGYIAQQVLSDLNSPKEVNATSLSSDGEFGLRTGLQKSKNTQRSAASLEVFRAGLDESLSS